MCHFGNLYAGKKKPKGGGGGVSDNNVFDILGDSQCYFVWMTMQNGVFLVFCHRCFSLWIAEEEIPKSFPGENEKGIYWLMKRVRGYSWLEKMHQLCDMIQKEAIEEGKRQKQNEIKAALGLF